MKFPVYRAQMLAVDVRVDLRGGDVLVAEHLLHGAEVGASFQQVRGEGVAEDVGVDLLLDAGGARPLLRDVPDRVPAERSAAHVEEEDVAAPLAGGDEVRPRLATVTLD